MEDVKVSSKQMVNGVNVEDLFGTIDAIKENSEIAKFKFNAENKWINGGLNQTTIKDFYGACQKHEHKKTFIFRADEPPILLSNDEAANPVEYALTALAACVTTSLVYHAAARGIRLESVESRLEGDLDLHGFLGMDENVRKGYEGVKISFKVKAAGSKEELMDAVKLGPTFSPVFDIFTNKVPVSVYMEDMDGSTMLMSA